jgi:hypothetical protein
MEITLNAAKFHRVHRFGRTGTGKPRPIVAKFVLYKDKELVQKSSKKLKGTHYGISDMYPREINERRKDLYPHYKRAREQGMKAVMTGDKLYINNKRFEPFEHNRMETAPIPTSRSNQSAPNGARGPTLQR